MSSRAPSGIARFDSAAAMAQATGAFLRGKDVASLSGVATSDRMMPIVNRLPRRLREWVYSVGGMTEAVNATDVQAVDVDGISRWITGRFPAGPYPAAFIGSSNGAAVHLDGDSIRHCSRICCRWPTRRAGAWCGCGSTILSSSAGWSRQHIATGTTTSVADRHACSSTTLFPYRTLRLRALPFWPLFAVERSPPPCRRFSTASRRSIAST
jgi:hypothetical protein